MQPSQVAQYELVTPEKAASYLQSQRENRSLKHAHLAYLVQAMNADQYVENGSPIRFDVEDRLADGQHRLTAITITGKSQRMLVVRGVKSEAIRTIDISAPRSVADQLRIERGERYLNVRIATTNTALRLLTGYIVPIKLADQFDEWNKIFKSGLDMLDEENIKLQKHMRNSYIQGAFAFAHKADPDTIRTLVTKVRDGVELQPAEPAMALRDYLLRRESSGEQSVSVSLKVLGACRAAIEDRTLQKLHANDQAREYFREFYDKGVAKKLVEAYKSSSVTAQIHIDSVTGRSREANKRSRQSAVKRVDTVSR